MLDEYGLRLLAEIGVDVYAPRQGVGSTSGGAGVAVSEQARPALDKLPGSRSADVLILGSAGSASRMLDDVLRAFRCVGLRAELSPAADAASLINAQNLVVLGETLARSLGADMPAQRHKAINWIFASEAPALAASASAKQGLWGEIKRLARSLRTHGPQE